MSDDFRIAYERARMRVGDRAWDMMASKARADAIYAELRALDASRIAEKARLQSCTSGGKQ